MVTEDKYIYNVSSPLPYIIISIPPPLPTHIDTHAHIHALTAQSFCVHHNTCSKLMLLLLNVLCTYYTYYLATPSVNWCVIHVFWLFNIIFELNSYIKSKVIKGPITSFRNFHQSLNLWNNLLIFFLLISSLVCGIFSYQSTSMHIPCVYIYIGLSMWKLVLNLASIFI